MENNSPDSSFKVIKKILFSIAVFLLIIISAAAIFSFLYSKEIKQYVISAINKNLDAEVTVGNVDFTVINKFPFASLEFTDVVVKEPRRLNSNDTLLHAKELSLLFNIMDVIRENYNLKKIVLTEASLNLKINKDGENNYEVWKKDSPIQSGNFKMELNKLEMQNVKINYLSITAAQNYSFDASNGLLSGNFSADNYTLKASANLRVQKFISEKVNFIKEKEAQIELDLKVDKKTNSYTIQQSTLQLGGLNFLVNGNIVKPEGSTLYDLSIEAKNADLKSLFSVIPSEYTKKIELYNFKGKVYFNSTIKGQSDKKQHPVFTMDFGTEAATISPKNSNYILKDLKFKGYYTSCKNEKSQGSYLSFKNVSGELQGRSINGNLEVTNFKDPVLHLEANASADLSVLSKFITIDTLENISGEIIVNNANFTGKVNDISTYVSSGNIVLKNAGFKFKQKPVVFSGVQGDLLFSKNNLKINSLSGKTVASDFIFTGTLDNFFGYFFTKNQKLNINAYVQSEKLDLNELMEKDKTSTLRDTVYKIRFADNLVFSISAAIGQLHFNKFNATEVGGTLQLNNSQLTTHSLKFNSMDGSVYLQGSIREISGDSLVVQYDASVKNLNITSLFYEMGNFGQQTITDKNLKGNVTADVQFLSKWSNTLNCNYDKIYTTATLAIENGELINFTPMLALSKYVKGSDLNDIKFSTLKNSIEIKNRKVIIPAMEINSSAMSIIASGVHGFDNIIEYHLQLLLSQLISKKVKNMNTEFGTIEDDNLGRTRLFITMKGPADNPKFSYDAKGVKEKVMVEISKEKQNLKEILKKEFGGNTEDDNSNKKEQTKKQEELQIDTSEENPKEE